MQHNRVPSPWMHKLEHVYRCDMVKPVGSGSGETERSEQPQHASQLLHASLKICPAACIHQHTSAYIRRSLVQSQRAATAAWVARHNCAQWCASLRDSRVWNPSIVRTAEKRIVRSKHSMVPVMFGCCCRQRASIRCGKNPPSDELAQCSGTTQSWHNKLT